MAHRADGMGMGLRTKTFDFIKGQFGTGSNNQIVVIENGVITQQNLISGGFDFGGARVVEIDVFTG